MSDIKLGVEVEGADQGAAKLDKLTRAVGEIQSKTQRAAPSVKGLERALKDESTAADRAATSSRRAAAATQPLGQAAARTANSAGQMAGALGNVGAVVGNVSPQLGQLGGVVGQVGTAVSALSGSMGPLGVAMSALTVGAGVFALAYRSVEDQLRRTREEAQRLSASLDEVIAQQRRMRQSRELERRTSRAGGASQDELAGRVQRARNQLDLVRRARAGDMDAQRQLGLRQATRDDTVGDSARNAVINTLRDRGVVGGLANFALTAADPTGLSGGAPGVARRLDSTTQRIQRQLDRMERTQRSELQRDMQRLRQVSRSVNAGAIRADETPEQAALRRSSAVAGLAPGGVTAGSGRGRGGGGRSGPSRREQELARELEANQALKQFEDRRLQDRLDREQQLERAALDRSQQEKAFVAQRMTQDEEAHRARLAQIEREGQKRLEQEAEAARRQQAANERMQAAFTEAGSRIGGFFTSVFDKAVSGQMDFEQAVVQSVKELLKSLGEEAIMKGSIMLLEGIGMTITNPPGAAAKIGAGVGLIGLGVAAGATSAAIPSAPSGGAAEARPTPSLPSGDQQAAGPVVINLGNLVTAGTYAETGQQLQRAYVEAQRQNPQRFRLNR